MTRKRELAGPLSYRDRWADRTRLMGVAAVLFHLAACGVAPENDPVYLALKANPPNEIAARHLPKLRRNIHSCDVFNEGGPGRYMTCWWPAPGSDPHVATLTYYRSGLIPDSIRLSAPGGEPVTDWLSIK